mmetsp:Transcript_40217/g.126578  ORF Transcript_40217/g.126578 Transcript_40217/m.126578 type:complete len:103 (+) Transcript_40217:1578-1886(+)
MVSFDAESVAFPVLLLNSSSPCVFLKHTEQYEFNCGDPKKPHPPAHRVGASELALAVPLSILDESGNKRCLKNRPTAVQVLGWARAQTRGQRICGESIVSDQ